MHFSCSELFYGECATTIRSLVNGCFLPTPQFFFFATASNVPWTFLYLSLCAHEQDSSQICACCSVTERSLGVCLYSFTRYCEIALQAHSACLHSPSSVSSCGSTALSTLVLSDVNCCQSDGCKMNLIVGLICSSLFVSKFLHIFISPSDGRFCG